MLSKKIFIISFVCIILAYIIFLLNKSNKINIMAIGDSFASGETYYKIVGVSYNNYLKEYFDNKKLLRNYNDDFAFKGYNLDNLLNDLKTNKLKNNNYINQLIHKSNIITINIGEEELTKKSIFEEIDINYIDELINNYNLVIKHITEITDSKIVVVGYFENVYLDKKTTILLNSKLANILSKYNVLFIDINRIMQNKEYFPNDNSYFFNYKGHKSIFDKIMDKL